MARTSIQARLLAVIVGGVAAVWLAAVALTAADVKHELDELLDAHLAQAAALLVVQQSGELEHDDDRTLDAPALHRYAPRAVFQVFHDRQLILRSADAPLAPLVDLDIASREGRFASVAVQGVDWRVFATRGGDRDVQVIVGERMAARGHILRAALWGTLWPLALALPLGALLAWWAIRRGLGPLRALHDELARRPAHSTESLALADAPAEVAPVVQALDGLFGRIDAMLQAERRFTADAAHELRTPIAAVRAQAQVALGETDEAARRHALRATIEGCDRASRLVDQLLTLSRVEAGATVSRTSVELGAVARQVAADLAPRALDRQQQLGLDAAPGCMLQADAGLLTVLVRNLVDNALRYSPPGARIEVKVERDAGGRARLTVEDSGPGLAPPAIAGLGRQRFQRAAGQAQSGSGLGWSIVRRVAEVLGLQVVAARSAALGGLAVTVQAPM